MEFESLKKQMVREQIENRGISERRVLEAFLKVDRHEFIPEGLQKDAYADFPVPIGDGQTASQPYIVALMTELLKLKGGEKVLEVGSGSGYQTAILLALSAQVFCVERIAGLAETADSNLRRLGYSNYRLRVGDGTLGWEQMAPFDRILVAAASTEVPGPLIEQLKDGGIMLIPLGDHFEQTLTAIEKKGADTPRKSICGCVFVPLVGKYGHGG